MFRKRCRLPARKWKVLLAGVLLIVTLHYIIKFEGIADNGLFQDIWVDPNGDYKSLRITHMEEFPSGGTNRIPRIIHQTWKTTDVPRKLTPWIQTWVNNHPNWEYILWTDASARNLIKERHPHLLNMYDNYPEGIRRADALRYVVLYEYGGVYADMDMESLKSLEPMILKYACFLAQEPYEHSILDGNFEHLVINALMGCRRKHPLMKKLMDSLQDFSHMWNVLDSTGPHFVTVIYRQYIRENRLAATHENGTYLAPAEYFFPTIDPAKHYWMRQQCISNVEKLSKIQKNACYSLKYKAANQILNEKTFAFTDHHWIHTYLQFSFSEKGPVDIHEVVPKAKILHGLFIEYTGDMKAKGS